MSNEPSVASPWMSKYLTAPFSYVTVVYDGVLACCGRVMFITPLTILFIFIIVCILTRNGRGLTIFTKKAQSCIIG